MQRQLVFVVPHDPRVHVLVVLTEYVRSEQIRSVDATHKVRRVLVEAVTDVGDDAVEQHGAVLDERAEFEAPRDRERHFSGFSHGVTPHPRETRGASIATVTF